MEFSPEGFYSTYRWSTYGKPFNRKDFLMNIAYYVEKGWGSYTELINLTMKDILEIKVGIESKMQEEQLEKALQGGY